VIDVSEIERHGLATKALEHLSVPTTQKAAMDPVWLTEALADVSGGRPVSSVEVLEVIRTVATKLRFRVAFEGAQETQALCLKGFLDVDEITARGGPTNVLEADFYNFVAGQVAVQAPARVATVIDRKNPSAVTIMRDLIADGARFCSALEPFTADATAQSLEQLAHLHAAQHLLRAYDWIKPRIASLADMPHMTPVILQELLDGQRGEGLPAETRNAARLIAAMKVLAVQDAARPQTLVHGDAHAGNIFRTAAGTGLIDWQLLQQGSWVLDVAYHINAVCDVATAAREERRLLDHYLDFARRLGVALPNAEAAWAAYRGAVVYGYYLWGITRRVDPAITVVFNNRLGNAVTRHGSYRVLDI
jgi:hypothetical protein